jgi:ribonuclease D
VKTPPALVLAGDLPREVADAVLVSDVVAVDTETSGLSWRENRLQLCQLYTAQTGPVFVHSVSRPPDRLAEVLSSTQVTKVFHFAPFDLRFLESQWHIETANVACTKAASKILDPHLPPSGHSLAQLALRYLEVTLDKGAVRTSDWGATTLSPEQLTYAASDVLHLPALLAVLTERLQATGRLNTWKAVCNYIPVDAHLEVSGIPNPLTY